MGQNTGREMDRGRERKGTEEVRGDWIKEDTEEDYGKGQIKGGEMQQRKVGQTQKKVHVERRY